MKILHRYTGEIIYKDDADTMRRTVFKAVANGADLRGANLRGANLRGADLRGADLRDADLHDAHQCVVLPVGDSRGYVPVAVWTDNCYWRIFAGCRSFTVAEARRHWGEGYKGDRETGDKYLYALDWLMQAHPVDKSVSCSIQRRRLTAMAMQGAA